MRPATPLAEVVIDLGAIRHNLRALASLVAPAAVMVVVKADGYGHGATEVARVARAEGCSWLGVATLAEALELRSAGDRGSLLCWLWRPGDQAGLPDAVAADIDLTAYTVDEVEAVAAAARATGRKARLQLKVDTGLSRGGAERTAWPQVVAAALTAQRAGDVEVTGIWSHLACSDEPGHPANDRQQAAYSEALAQAQAAGLAPGLRHLANSAAALHRPHARYDAVRIGLAAYGLDPAPGVALPVDLRPALRLTAALAMSKPLAAGESVSYGQTWTAPGDTSVGLVPVGYGDGVLRSASNRAEVTVADARRAVRGRICMDQFVVDLGGELPPAGTEVVVIGDGARGEPSAHDWAVAAETISYEIVVRLGSGRVPRRYVDEERG